MKKVANLLLVLFCLRSDGAYVSFSGMSQNDVDSMLLSQGKSCSYISKAAFDAGVLNVNQIVPPNLGQIQTDVSTLNVSTNTVVQKLPALIDLLKQKGLLQ